MVIELEITFLIYYFVNIRIHFIKSKLIFRKTSLDECISFFSSSSFRIKIKIWADRQYCPVFCSLEDYHITFMLYPQIRYYSYFNRSNLVYKKNKLLPIYTTSGGWRINIFVPLVGPAPTKSLVPKTSGFSICLQRLIILVPLTGLEPARPLLDKTF